MQIALKDVRNIGYRKIYQGYFHSERHFNDFINKAERLYADLGNVKVKPYSLVNYWDELSKLSGSTVGIRNLIESIDPLVGVNPRVKFIKAKFRNTWDSIWEKFGEANNLSARTITILSDLCIKIPLVLASYKFESERLDKLNIQLDVDIVFEFLLNVADFCNIILNWYCETQFESILMTNDKTILDALGFLALTSDEDFNSKLSTGGSIWG